MLSVWWWFIGDMEEEDDAMGSSWEGCWIWPWISDLKVGSGMFLDLIDKEVAKTCDVMVSKNLGSGAAWPKTEGRVRVESQ